MAGIDEDITLDQAIAKMKDEYIRCRDFGHAWRPYHVRELEDGYDQQLRCTRCYTVKSRMLSFTGQQLNNHYEYKDGYVTKGLGRLTGEDRDQIRLASVLRTMKPAVKFSDKPAEDE